MSIPVEISSDGDLKGRLIPVSFNGTIDGDLIVTGNFAQKRKWKPVTSAEATTSTYNVSAEDFVNGSLEFTTNPLTLTIELPSKADIMNVLGLTAESDPGRYGFFSTIRNGTGRNCEWIPGDSIASGSPNIGFNQRILILTLVLIPGNDTSILHYVCGREDVTGPYFDELDSTILGNDVSIGTTNAGNVIIGNSSNAVSVGNTLSVGDVIDCYGIYSPSNNLTIGGGPHTTIVGGYFKITNQSGLTGFFYDYVNGSIFKDSLEVNNRMYYSMTVSDTQLLDIRFVFNGGIYISNYVAGSAPVLTFPDPRGTPGWDTYFPGNTPKNQTFSNSTLRYLTSSVTPLTVINLSGNTLTIAAASNVSFIGTAGNSLATGQARRFEIMFSNPGPGTNISYRVSRAGPDYTI